MARKIGLSAKDVKREEFIVLTEYKHELAVEAYAAQDAETQEAIDKLVHVLTQYNTGVEFDVSDKLRKQALFVVAIDVVKDLALLDIRVADFVFTNDICVKCGGEV